MTKINCSLGILFLVSRSHSLTLHLTIPNRTLLNSFHFFRILLDWSKLKAFADDKMNVNERLKFGLGMVENIVGKMKKDIFNCIEKYWVLRTSWPPPVVRTSLEICCLVKIQPAVFTSLQYKCFKKTNGKGEICNTMTFGVGTNIELWIHIWRCTFNIIHALGSKRNTVETR